MKIWLALVMVAATTAACDSVVTSGSGRGGEAGSAGAPAGGAGGSTATPSGGSGGAGGSTSTTTGETWFCAGTVACCANPACAAPDLCACAFNETVVAASAPEAVQQLLEECRAAHPDDSCGLWTLVCGSEPVDPGPCP